MGNVEKAGIPNTQQDPSTANATESRDPSLPLSKTKSSTSAALGKVASHLNTRSIRDPGPPPDGGVRAWTQVFCAWLAILNTWGFVNSFGAFQTYYTEKLPESPSTISWIGSTQACILFVLGMFSGRALDAGYFRPTVIIGICFQLVGIFTMSVAKNYWQLILTQGICTGVGGGIFFVPIMGLVSTYFAKRRGMAVGIVTSGNSAGGIVYPLVVRQLLGKLGFGWTVRVLGFINIVSLVVVIAFMKPRLPPRKSGPLVDWASFGDVPYCLHVLGMCFLMPPVYFVFYYVRFFLYSFLLSSGDPEYALESRLIRVDRIFCKRGAGHGIHWLPKSRHNPQWRRHSRSCSAGVYSGPLPRRSQHARALPLRQHYCSLGLAWRQLYLLILHIYRFLWALWCSFPIALSNYNCSIEQ